MYRWCLNEAISIWGKSAAFHFGVKIFWCQHTLRVLILLFQKPTKFLKLCSFTVLLSRELVLGMVCTHQFMYLSIFSPQRGCGIQWGIKTKFKTVLSNFRMESWAFFRFGSSTGSSNSKQAHFRYALSFYVGLKNTTARVKKT